MSPTARLAGAVLAPVRRVAHAAHLRYKAAFDEAELRLVPRLCPRDRAFLDVGAHQGVYSWVAAQTASQVFAVEPNPWTAAALTRLFGDRVAVITAALSDHRGKVTLHVPIHEGRPLASRASIDPELHRGAETMAIEVPCRRLDELELPPLGMIKVDVEGHEHAVLAGAFGTLARDRPALLVEIEERHAAGATREVPRMLSDLGYEGHFLLDGRLQPISDFRVEIHQRAERAKPPDGPRRGLYINNFVFTPRARARGRGSPGGSARTLRARGA